MDGYMAFGFSIVLIIIAIMSLVVGKQKNESIRSDIIQALSIIETAEYVDGKRKSYKEIGETIIDNIRAIR